MKKFIITVLLIAVFIGVLAGCGNMSFGAGNFTYEKIHVDTHNYSGCFTVEKWHENPTGVEVKTKEVGSMYLSEGTYIMLDGNMGCPFCEAMEG